MQGAAGFEVRQSRVERPMCGFLPCRVAVEAKRRQRDHRPQKPQLIGCQRGPERSDGVREARSRQRDDVHVAFRDDDRFRRFRRFTSRREIEEDMALVKQLRLGRIEIFRLLIGLKSAASKGDDPALCVHDREDQAATETVIGDRDVLAVDQKPRILHLGERETLAAKMLLQRRLAVRSVAKPERLDLRELNAPPFEISARNVSLASGKRRFEKAACLLQRLANAGFVAHLGLIDGLRSGQDNARLRREPLHRFRKRQPRHLHEKAENVAVFAARETVVKTLMVVHRKRGRLFGLEGG